MEFKVIEIDRYHDEHLIESTLDYADARKAAFDYWKNLFPCDKRDSEVQVRYFNNEDYDIIYCLRLYNYPELSNESLFDLYNSLDYEIFELAKEITRRCERLEEWLDADDENEDEEILSECLEMLI
jgi:hypothetical protein